MKFSTLTIVSVISGKLLDRIDKIYKILDFMTCDAIFTHQIPRAAKTCGDELRKQFPELAAIQTENVSPDNAESFCRQIITKYGEEKEVSALPHGIWKSKDPIEELLEIQIREQK